VRGFIGDLSWSEPGSGVGAVGRPGIDEAERGEKRFHTQDTALAGLLRWRSSGQPESFEEQGEIIWQHIGTIMRSAGMDYHDLVSLRTYLAHPSYDEANVRLRVKYLGDHRPA
jgi:hypothetical protein